MNTLKGSWHFDDFLRIVNNDKLHVTRLEYDSIKNLLYSHEKNTIPRRPISHLTFGLNWFLHGDNVIGYHVVNLFVHIFSAFLLYLTILNLFLSPNLRDKYHNLSDIYFIAMLSAALWAVHPMQTQAVNYIVQRMASLAALFFILAVFLYVKGRLSSTPKKKKYFFIGCAFSYLLSIGSKENAAFLPIILVFLEYIFFQNLYSSKAKKHCFAIIISGVLLISIAGIFWFKGGGALQHFEKIYALKPFTMVQRLISEPRVLIFHISQLVYPAPERFSLLHNIPASHNLIQPITSMLSIIAIILLIFLSLYLIRKQPVVSFAILFFFVNHSIESSILPLELAFEHRNYLPSMFLFVLLSIAILQAFKHYQTKDRMMHKLMVGCTIFLMIWFSFGTYIRNMDWATEITLMNDASKKAPRSYEPYQNLGLQYIKIGAFDKALRLLNQALAHAKISDDISAIYFNKAKMFTDLKQDFENGEVYAKEALKYNSENMAAKFLLSHIYMKENKLEQANQQIGELLKINPLRAKYIDYQVNILLRQEAYDKAIPYARKGFRIEPNNWKYFYYAGVALTLNNHYQRGLWFLRKAETLSSRNAVVILAMAYNRLSTGRQDTTAHHVDRFIQLIGIEKVKQFFNRMGTFSTYIPPQFNSLRPCISEQVRLNISETLVNINNL